MGKKLTAIQMGLKELYHLDPDNMSKRSMLEYIHRVLTTMLSEEELQLKYAYIDGFLKDEEDTPEKWFDETYGGENE